MHKEGVDKLITANWFLHAIRLAFNKEIDYLDDTIKVMLVSNAWVPDQLNNDYLDEVTNEITGAGYTAGGITLTNKAITPDANRMRFVADDITWTGATFTARYAVVYDDTPFNASSKPLLGYIDFGEDKTVNNGTFTITWSDYGVLHNTITVIL